MKCPGQDTRYWKQDSIYSSTCPECGTDVEFFKDDTTRKCGKCGHRFLNPSMDFGCAAYCEHAAECIGNLPPELIAQKQDLLKDRVAIEMKRYFRSDFKRISHAVRVARYAEHIGKKETLSNMAVILCAAYLHDIGIHAAEKKYGSTAAKYQEIEGPPIARDILGKLGAKPELVNEVCDIVEHHHHPRDQESINFKSLYDADLIANIEDKHKNESITPEKLEQIINKSFLTDSGKRHARKVLLN
jgi:HD superfamily phosphohydrolase YqeK/ribosomal protein S27AE